MQAMKLMPSNGGYNSSQYPGALACAPATQLWIVSAVVYAMMQNPNTTRKISDAFCQVRVATTR